jgi:hypothetical protein
MRSNFVSKFIDALIPNYLLPLEKYVASCLRKSTKPTKPYFDTSLPSSNHPGPQAMPGPPGIPNSVLSNQGGNALTGPGPGQEPQQQKQQSMAQKQQELERRLEDVQKTLGGDSKKHRSRKKKDQGSIPAQEQAHQKHQAQHANSDSSSSGSDSR